MSPVANPVRDLVAFGSFPRASDAIGLNILVPCAEYMLALKLMALRVSDFDKGTKDMSDVANLLRVLDIADVEPAIEILRRYFPKSATHADKQRFVLKYILSEGNPSMRPATLAEAVERMRSGEPHDAALAEFLDTFYLAPTPERRLATLAEEPALTGDARLDALVGAMADYLARQYRTAAGPGLGIRSKALSGSALAHVALRRRRDARIPDLLQPR